MIIYFSIYLHSLLCFVRVIDHKKENWICRASIKLPPALWKQKKSPELTLAYTASGLFSLSDDAKRQDASLDSSQLCHLSFNKLKTSFIPIPPVNIAHSVPDAIRDLGRSLLLQIPRRELKTNEDFFVTVRLKHFDDVSDFTLRCEIPSNTYVEFVQVIWPAGVGTLSSSSPLSASSLLSPSTSHSLSSSSPSSSPLMGDPNPYTGVDEFLNSPTSSYTPPTSSSASSASSASSIRSEIRPHNMWDVFHRSIISQKRNITEIVARFREDLAVASPPTKYSSATEVYKLQFRVKKPEADSPGRVAPRIFWSLTSLSRRNSPDHAVSASPVVTRLNIEPSELKHITMVLKTSALVNLAVLTGQPTTYPIWVYGLTHDLKIIDITSKATCHTGDDAVIHFAQDMCSKLGFSGAELDGSPGLPLVAKMDGRSATATLLVWFPKAPALKMIVETSTNSNHHHNNNNNINNYDSSNQESSNVITLKRLATEVIASHSNFRKSLWANQINSTGSLQFFQYFRVRILARFILASSVLHDKDVLGGRINQYVDVTEFTAHRLRLEYTHDSVGGSGSGGSGGSASGNIGSSSSVPDVLNFESPARLLTIGEIPTRQPHHSHMHSIDTIKRAKPLRVWLVGQHPGSVKIHLAPIDRSLVNSFIPPGLAKQLKDHIANDLNVHQFEGISSNQSQYHSSLARGDQMLKEPSVTIRVTDETSIWPVGISAQLVTDFSVLISHPSGVDDTRQRGGPPSPFSNNNINENSNSNNNNHLFGATSTERMPVLSGVYSIHIQLKGSKLTHSGSINSEFNNQERGVHSSQQTISTTLSSEYLNQSDKVRYPHRHPQESRQMNSVGFLIVWIHLSDGSSVLWNRMAEIYEQLYGKDKIPLNLSIRNYRPDLFWIETNSAGVVERKLRSARRSRFSSTVTHGRQDNSHLSGLRLFRKSRSVRMKPHLTASVDPSSSSLNQLAYGSLLEKDLSTGMNTSSYWSGPVVWFLHKGLKFSGDILEVGLTSPSGNILVPHVRIHADIVTSNNGISMNDYIIKSKDTNRIDPKLLQTVESTGGNIHNSMAFKDSPGYYGSQSVASMTTRLDKKRVKGSFDESVHQKPNYFSSSTPQVKDKSSSHSLSINSDENSHLDDRQSILSDVGGGGGHIPSDSREAIKDTEDKQQHMNSRSGGSASKISDISDRGGDASGGNSARPVLEMSMYILLGLFAVVGLVFAVNCGVVVIRYRWEKKNTRKRNAGTIDDSNANDNVYDSNNTSASCIRKKRNKSISRNTPSPSLPLTSGLLNKDDDEIVDNNQIMSSMHASSSCKRMHRSKSDVENQERLLTTSNNSSNNNSNKDGGKRTKRSATSMFTSRQKHKPLLHRDSSWVWVGRQQVIGEQNETSNQDYNLKQHHQHLSHAQMHYSAPPNENNNNNSNNNNPNQIDSKHCHSHKRSLQFNESKKHPTTAVLSVGEADMLLLQSPYRENVWQDTIRSSTIESESQFLLFASVNGGQFGCPDGKHLTPEMSSQFSPTFNLSRNECQTLGRNLRRHTGGFTQRNYQGQECSIRIISNPLSDNNNNKRQSQSQQPQNQFTNPQLFMSQYPSENINYAHNTVDTLTKSAIVCDSWLSTPYPVPLTGSASASLHRKYIPPHCIRDEYGGGEQFNSKAFTPNMIRSNQVKNLSNYPVLSNSPQPIYPPLMISSPLPDYRQTASSEATATTAAAVAGQHNWIKSVSNDDSHDSYNHSSIDRPDCTTNNEMLDVSSPICPLNSPWQIRRPQKSTKKRSHQQKQQQHHSEYYPDDKICDQMAESNGDDDDEGVSEKNDIYYSQNPPFPPVRTTSRGTILCHTLGHLKRNNNYDNNNHHSRPLSLPQSFHATNELYSTLCKTDSSNECMQFLMDDIRGEHEKLHNIIKTDNNNNVNNTNVNPTEITLEVCQDCLQPTTYFNKQQSPSEESLWWYHPVHQKRRRKRKHESKKHAGEIRSGHHNHQHLHLLQQPQQKHHQHHKDKFIPTTSGQSNDLLKQTVGHHGNGGIVSGASIMPAFKNSDEHEIQKNYLISDLHDLDVRSEFQNTPAISNPPLHFNNDLIQEDVEAEEEQEEQVEVKNDKELQIRRRCQQQQPQQQHHYQKEQGHEEKEGEENLNNQLNSQSDLSWDQELLCLSHDRLVAYFAEMKESNA
ncbi:unnamed protein product [Trichobilharzia szidati]|nr:unnamed protein product [Trichobilharzia szidati]